MASFVFLTPPSHNHGSEGSLAIRDSFSLLSYLIPPLWFACHRLWFAAALSLCLLVLAGLLSDVRDLAGIGPCLAIAVNVFCGLESRNMLIRHHERKGWRMAAALEARNLEEAEEIFFSNAAHQPRTPAISTGTAPVSGISHRSGDDHRPVLGLFDLYGGR